MILKKFISLYINQDYQNIGQSKKINKLYLHLVSE